MRFQQGRPVEHSSKIKIMDLMMIKCFLVAFLILEGTTETAVSATNFTVGGDTGWIVPPSPSFYAEWARNKNFSVGDRLIFNWNRTHDVANVSQDVYNDCSISSVPTNQILFSSPGHEYSIKGNGSLYFICTIGNHCSEGQKLSIKIGAESSFSALPPLPSYALILICFLGYI